MCLLAALDSQGIVVECTAAIFFRTVDCGLIDQPKTTCEEVEAEPAVEKNATEWFC